MHKSHCQEKNSDLKNNNNTSSTLGHAMVSFMSWYRYTGPQVTDIDQLLITTAALDMSTDQCNVPLACSHSDCTQHRDRRRCPLDYCWWVCLVAMETSG